MCKSGLLHKCGIAGGRERGYTESPSVCVCTCVCECVQQVGSVTGYVTINNVASQGN